MSGNIFLQKKLKGIKMKFENWNLKSDSWNILQLDGLEEGTGEYKNELKNEEDEKLKYVDCTKGDCL
jgi:hypothetical protein